MGTPLIAPTPEWAAELGKFTSWLRAGGKKESSIKLRSYQLRRFSHTTRLRPFAVTTEDLADYLGSHQWGGSAKRSARSALVSFYTWAHSSGRISTNPARLLPTVKTPKGKPAPVPEAVLADGLDRADDRVRLILSLAAYAGLRCDEISRVHARHLEADLLGWSLRVVGKGDTTRIVPLNDRLAGQLLALPGGYAFPGRIDGHLSGAHVSKLASRALADGWSAHKLRHRFASVAYARGGKDIRVVQELLGHASVATTQIYTAINSRSLRTAVLAAA